MAIQGCYEHFSLGKFHTFGGNSSMHHKYILLFISFFRKECISEMCFPIYFFAVM